MEIIQNHRSNQHNNMIGSFVSGAVALGSFVDGGGTPSLAMQASPIDLY